VITQLGTLNGVGAKAEANATQIVLRAPLKGEYAYSFKLAEYLR